MRGMLTMGSGQNMQAQPVVLERRCVQAVLVKLCPVLPPWSLACLLVYPTWFYIP